MRVYHFLGYACRWDQNAETMSASPQLVANGGDPEWLFSEAIIQSGTLFPVGDVTPGEKHYDDLVLRTSRLHTEDTLDYLRRTPCESLGAATGTSVGVFDYTARVPRKTKCGQLLA